MSSRTNAGHDVQFQYHIYDAHNFKDELRKRRSAPQVAKSPTRQIKTPDLNYCPGSVEDVSLVSSRLQDTAA